MFFTALKQDVVLRGEPCVYPPQTLAAVPEAAPSVPATVSAPSVLAAAPSVPATILTTIFTIVPAPATAPEVKFLLFVYLFIATIHSLMILP